MSGNASADTQSIKLRVVKDQISRIQWAGSYDSGGWDFDGSKGDEGFEDILEKIMGYDQTEHKCIPSGGSCIVYLNDGSWLKFVDGSGFIRNPASTPAPRVWL